MIFKPYKNNILIKPKDKEKIIGNTATKYLYGEVLDIGSDVKNITIGDTIGYTQWGINKIITADNEEHFFVQDNPDFILGTSYDK